VFQSYISTQTVWYCWVVIVNVLVYGVQYVLLVLLLVYFLDSGAIISRNVSLSSLLL